MKEKFHKAYKWLENYWYHYQWSTIIVGVLVVFAIVVAVQFATRVSYDFYIGYVGPEYVDVITFDPIDQEIKSAVGDLNGDGEANIGYKAYILGSAAQDASLTTAIGLAFTVGDERVFIIDKGSLEGKYTYLMPLEGIVSDEALEDGIKYGGKVVAMSLKDNPKMEAMDLPTEDMYIVCESMSYLESKTVKDIDSQIEASKRVIKYFAGE